MNLYSQGLITETSAPYHTELSSMEVKVRLYVNQQKMLPLSECSPCTTDALIYPAEKEGHSDPDRALVPDILTLVTT